MHLTGRRGNLCFQPPYMQGSRMWNLWDCLQLDFTIWEVWYLHDCTFLNSIIARFQLCRIRALYSVLSFFSSYLFYVLFGSILLVDVIPRSFFIQSTLLFEYPNRHSNVLQYKSLQLWLALRIALN